MQNNHGNKNNSHDQLRNIAWRLIYVFVIIGGLLMAYATFLEIDTVTFTMLGSVVPYLLQLLFYAACSITGYKCLSIAEKDGGNNEI